MSDESIQVIAAAVVALAQLYAVEPWRFPVFAYFWDFVAKLTGILANILAHISINARVSYFEAVNQYGS